MVTKKTPDLAGFGNYLKLIRKKAGIKSPRQAALMTQRKQGEVKGGPSSIEYSQSYSDEKGLVFDIPAVRLRAYADLYKVPYEEIVAQLVKEKYGIDLIPVEDAGQPKTLRDVVPLESVSTLEAVAAALKSEKGEEVKRCIANMLDLAFPGPNSQGQSSTLVGEVKRNKGAA